MNSLPNQMQRVRVLVICDRLSAAGDLLAALHYGNYQVDVSPSTSDDDSPDDDIAALLATYVADRFVGVILLDALVANSYNLCSRLRAVGIAVPIVFFSTGECQPDAGQVFAAGGTDYLAYPVVEQEVYARLKTHVELDRSHRKFHQLFMANPTPMAISTLEDGCILEANPAFAELAGYDLADLVGRSTLDLKIWADPEERSRIVQAIRANQPILDWEIQGKTRTGETKIVSLSMELIDYNGQDCLFSRAIDVTARKQMDEQRQRRADMYTLLSDISRQLLNQDPDTAIQYTLKAIGEFTTSDRVNIIQADTNHKTLSMTHEWCAEGVPPCLTAIQHVNPDDFPWILQQLLTGQPLEIFHMQDLPPEAIQECAVMVEVGVKSTVIVPMVNAETIAGYLSADAVYAERRWSTEDISLFRLVGELIAIAQARYAAEETQRLYMHAVSHDLRNPVVGMSMIVKNLLAQTTTTASDIAQQATSLAVPTRLLTRIDHNCDRQLHLINSLVEASEVEMWGVALQCQPIALPPLLAELAETWAPILADHHATLEHHAAPTLPLVYADPSQLWRVLENLLANALKHNPPGIRLLLTAELLPTAHQPNTHLPDNLPDNLPNASPPRTYLRCSLADDGVGIDPAQAVGIFERYRRGTSAAKTRGLGLGLYLCRQIVVAHGGTIGVETSPQAGATFWFTLPIVA
jgi:PAS domain S-box-containing protein